MPSTYSSDLRLELQADGENSSTWGSKTNTNLQLIEDAVAGMVSVATTGGTTVLTTVNGGTDQSRYAIIKVTGALVSNATIQIPDVSKIYLIWNATTEAFTLTVKATAGTGTLVTQGSVLQVFCDGSEVYDASASVADAQELTNKTLNASVGKGTWTASGTWTLPALTLGGNVSSSGNPSLNIGTGALTAGTGTFSDTITSTKVGQVFYSSGVTTSAKYLRLTNSGNDAYWGIESSTGGGIIAGSTAYATVFTSANATPIHFGNSSGILGTFSSTGLAVAGGVAVGGATVASSGIAFPAVAVAVADPNTLDDYEEGTWTPGQGSGLTVVGAFSSSGTYTKIGRVVTVTAQLTGATSVAFAGGAAQVCTGLPFSPTASVFSGIAVNGAANASATVYAQTNTVINSVTALAATPSIYISLTYFATS